MTGLAILLGLLAAPEVAAQARGEWVEQTFSNQAGLEVQVRSSQGQELPGAAVFLCPMEGPDTWAAGSLSLAEVECSVGIADAHGVARFPDLQPASFQVRVELDGFARTVVYPLEVGDSYPRAPDQILVVLNAVCWDC